ncbi:MAG: hypothetical protein OEO23_11485 [Gemmatimonadota bacterium]|nr:hypothetical protein [Gemmatimonadota bacterium]
MGAGKRRLAIRLVFLATGTLNAWGLARPGFADAQEAGLAAEGQAYPAGWTIRGGPVLSWGVWAAALTGGYNGTNRKDWGEHDHEEGGGAGLGVRVTRALGPPGTGAYGEARLDLWFLSLDWRDGGDPGRTRVRVVQPMVGGGYGWARGVGFLRLGLALGLEINTGVRGEPVGEGPVLAVGLGLDLGVSATPR